MLPKGRRGREAASPLLHIRLKPGKKRACLRRGRRKRRRERGRGKGEERRDKEVGETEKKGI